MINLNKYKQSEFQLYVNLFKMPTTTIGLDEYNEIVRYFNGMYDNGQINRQFKHTKSGGISVKDENYIYNYNCYECRETNGMHEIIINTFIENDFYCCRLQYKHSILDSDVNIDNENKICGHNAFLKFVEELKKDNIDIKDYMKDNQLEVKKTIPSPLIKITSPIYIHDILNNCFHIDINSAYPYAMTLLFPEWKDTITRIYNKKKELSNQGVDGINNIYKAVLNYTFGYFQSKGANYKLSYVSKYAIEETIKRLLAETKFLESNNCKVISYNTDGIWFQCDDTYTQNILIKYYQGKELGQFKMDHKNCILRHKSSGSYEFIEDDKYYPVVRGKTKLDKIKDRSQWQFGDIYQAQVIKYANSKTEYGIIDEVGEW